VAGSAAAGSGVLLAPPAQAAVTPQPVVSISASPAQPFVGASTVVTVRFDNDQSDDPATPAGFGPFIDLALPPGADGNDGLTLTGVTYFGGALPTTSTPCVAGVYTQPYTGDVRPCAAGTTIVSVRVPFGSFTTTQPPSDLAFALAVSNLADVGTAMTLTATGGFIYGASATGGTPIYAPATTTTVTPTIATVTKQVDTTEGETATGPDFPHHYTLSLDVAAGQTITNAHLTDTMPPGVVVTAVTASPPGYTVVHQPPIGTTSLPPAAGLDVLFASITGAAGVDATVTVTFYVPATDASGVPTTDPVTGAWTTTSNTAAATGNWTPVDPRDPTLTGVTLGSATISHTDKPLTVVKTVTNVSNPAGPNRPGDQLQYTISWTASDFTALSGLNLADVLGDGQTVTGSPAPSFTFTDSGTTRSGALGGAFSSAVNGCAAPSPGATAIGVDVSAADLAAGGDGVATGGQLPGGSGAASGTVVFDATIDPVFRCVAVDPDVIENDTVTNGVSIDATIVASGHAVPTDTSSTSVLIGLGTLTKAVYAINGSTVFPTPARAGAGDVVTYRITETHLAGNFKNYQVDDYLPLPQLSATQVGTFDPTASAAVPPAGTVKYGPADTFHQRLGFPVPTLTSDAVANSFTLDFGKHLTGSLQPDGTIDLLVSVTVTNQPFVDGSFIVNEVQTMESNTAGAVSTSRAVTGLTLAGPLVRIRKGVVATSRPSGATFTPATTAPAGVTFNGAAGTFTGTVSSADIGATLDSNVSGVETADTVTFAVTAQNIGSGVGGAVGLQLADACPAGLACGSPTGFSVRNGAGTALAFTGSAAAFFGAGITLTGAVPACGAYTAGACTDATGHNVVVVMVTVPLTAAVLPSQVMTNTASTVFYSDAATADPLGNPPANFAATDLLPDSDPATVTSRALTITKTLTATSAAHTTGSNLTIGEQATFTVVLTVPQGTTDALSLQDRLPAARARLDSVTSIVCSAPITDAAGACGNPAAATGIRTDTLGVTFGTVTNSDTNPVTNETITVVYSATVTNVVANASPLSWKNNATATWTGASGTLTASKAVTATIVEPKLTLTKVAAPARADAGDTITFTLVLANSGAVGTDAFDVDLSDAVPAVFLFPSAPVFSGGTCTAPDTAGFAGNTLSAHWSTLAPGRSCTITFTATYGTTATNVASAVTNTASATWTSLPGASPDERTGADGSAGLNHYVVSASGTVTPSWNVTKALTSSDLAATTGTNLTVGETGHWLLTVTVPEGTSAGFKVVDTLPAGMRYVVGSQAEDTSAFTGTLPAPTFSAVGQTLTWTFGATSVPAGPGSTGNVFTLAIDATVQNNVANTAPAVRTNSATLTPTGGAAVTGTAGATIVEPRLALIKNIVETTAGRTDTVTVALTVTNTGTSPAYEAVVTDPLPASLTFGSVTSFGALGWTLASTSPVTFTTPLLGVGGSDTVQFTAVVAASVNPGQVVSNTAGADATSYPGVSADERGAGVPGAYHTSSTDTFTVTGPDLVVTKTDGVTTVAPGQALSYTVTVTNAGGHAATGVVVTDALPANLVAVAAPATGSCPAGTVGGGTVTFAVGALAIGGTVQCSVTGTVRRPYPSGASALVNTATAVDDGTFGADPTPANNTATDTDTVSGGPVLSLSKTDGVTTAVPGDTLTYTLVVADTGPVDAAGTSVTDTLPAHTTFVSATATGGTFSQSGGQLVWTVGGLAGDGGAQTLQVTVRVDATVPAGVASVTNSAVATAVGAAPASATDTDVLDAAPDLKVTKNDGIQTRHPGDVYDYTMTVTNHGDQDATGVVVTDTLPPGLTCLAPGSPGSHTSPGTCSPGSAVFTTNLAAGAGTVFTLTVQVADPAPAGVEQLVNHVTVADDGTNGPDPTPADNTDTDTDLLAAAPHLTVTKTDGVTTVAPGDTVTWTVTVRNTGDQDTAAASVVDTLPAGTTFVSASAGGAHSGATVTWSSVAVAAGGTTTLTVTATVDSPVAAGLEQVTNLVTVTDPEGTGPGGVTALDTDALDAAPDVAVTKTDGVANASPGDTLTYTVGISNVGDQDAGTVTVVDTLPPALDAGSVSAPGAVVDTAAGTVTWTLASLAAGGSTTRTFTVDVRNPAPAGTTQFTNTVHASTSGDPDPSNDTATDADGLGPTDLPDLQVLKSADVSSVVAHGTVTWTLLVTNLGNVDDAGVTATDHVPAGFTVTDAGGGTVTGSPATGQTVTWTVATLAGGGPSAAGSQVTLTLETTAPDPVPAGLEQVQNTASVDDGPGGDIPDSKNTATADVALDAVPDLRVTKSDGVTSTRQGAALTYTVTVTNVGTQDAAGVVLTDTPGAGLTVTDPGGATAGPGGVYRWTVGPLAAGASATRTLVVSVADPLPAGTATVANTATAADDGAGGPDPSPSDNTATDTDAVGVDLSVTKSDGVTELHAGAPVTWVITVTNHGPATLTAVDVTDPLPDGLDAAGLVWTPSAGGYDPATGHWIGLSLAAGGSVTLSATGTVAPDRRTDVVNTVTVDPVGFPETDPVDNTATDSDPVVARTDVSIVKTVDPSSVRPGGAMTWTLRVSNAGPAAADSVVVTDPIPSAVLAVQAHAPAGWSCADAAGTWTCAVAQMAAASTASITFTGTDTAVEGAVTNTATVTTTSVDTDPVDDTSTAVLTVTPDVDLGVVKTLLTAQPVPGGAVTYRIVVTNHAISPFRDQLVVVDRPRSGLGSLSGDGPGWTCAPTGSAGLRCTSDQDLAPGAAATPVTVTASVTAAPGGTAVNAASVAVAGDQVPGNDASTATFVLAERLGGNGGAAGSGKGGWLSRTGTDLLGPVLLGLLLLVSGGGAMALAHRRRR
jgi:uncharacterized repeat protein (TIGR01451 family)